MAVNPALLTDARRKRAELEARRLWWDSLINSLTVSTGAAPPPLDQYRKEYNDHLAEKTRSQNHARQSRFCIGLAATADGRMVNWFTKKGLPRETDLARLYSQQDTADAAIKAIEGNLATFIGGPLSADSRFLAKVDKALHKGDHAGAEQLLRGFKPVFYKRWFMSAADRAAYATDLAALSAKIKDHSKATRDLRQVQLTLSEVEKETARAIKKIMRNDAGKLLDPSNPDVARLAKTNPSVALLLRHAGIAFWTPISTIEADLRRDRSVSLTSIQDALQMLEGTYVSRQITAKDEAEKADKKRIECEEFIKKCHLQKSHELTAASGFYGRDDLEKAFDDAIAAAGTMSDKDMQILIDKFNDRHARWVPAAHQTDISADAAALTGTATFAPHMMHPSAIPAFSRAARLKEHVKAGVMAAYRYVIT